jgi:hypothetical protein
VTLSASLSPASNPKETSSVSLRGRRSRRPFLNAGRGEPKFLEPVVGWLHVDPMTRSRRAPATPVLRPGGCCWPKGAPSASSRRSGPSGPFSTCRGATEWTFLRAWRPWRRVGKRREPRPRKGLDSSNPLVLGYIQLS